VFGKLFGKGNSLKAPTEPYAYGEDLILNWSPDSEGWVAPIAELGIDAQVYIGPEEGVDRPKDSTCESIINALNNIQTLVQTAKVYLAGELNRSERYKDNPILEVSLRPTGIEIFEHEKTPGEYSITFDPEFDSGAIYRVRFKDGKAYEWGFDD